MELGFAINYETGLKICHDIIDLSFERHGHYLRSELIRVVTNIFNNLYYIASDVTAAPLDIMHHFINYIDNSDNNDNSKELVSSILNMNSIIIGGRVSMKKQGSNKKIGNLSNLYKYLETVRSIRADALYLVSLLGDEWLALNLKCYLTSAPTPIDKLPAIDALDRVIESVGTSNIDNLKKLLSPELLATSIFLSSSIPFDDNTIGFQKCKKYYDLGLVLNKNSPTNSMSLAFLVAANNYNNVEGAFEAMKHRLAVKGAKITARMVRALAKNAIRYYLSSSSLLSS
jgi:hypothetical protein